MGQVLHGSARTPASVRRAIQPSQESLRVLAKRYGINQKTVAKWKKRTATQDLPTGPKDAYSTVLSIEDEAIIVAFRKHTLLPLDEHLLPMLGHIDGYQHGVGGSRSALGHDRSVSKGLSRQLHFRDLLAGHGHLDEACGRYAPLPSSRPGGPSSDHFPMCYGIQFTNQARHKYAFHHIFDRVCDEHDIEHQHGGQSPPRSRRAPKLLLPTRASAGRSIPAAAPAPKLP